MPNASATQKLHSPFAGKHVLFAISSLGLGHVYRSLPVVRFCLASGCKLTLLCHGRALKALRLELAEHHDITYHDYADYPPIQQRGGFFQDSFFLIDLIRTGFVLKKERLLLEKLITEQQIDMVFADGRFGFTSKKIPCYLICHQTRFKLPLRISMFQPLMDLTQYLTLKRFTKIIVPDHADPKECLSGKLSHNWISRALKPVYIGFLSSAKKTTTQDSIDILFITGGFIDQERKLFIQWAKRQLATLKQRVVIVQGEHDADTSPTATQNGIEIRANISGSERDALMSAANLLVGRTGYTTLMDICELKVKAVLLPTPRMTEQWYLARRIAKWRYSLPEPFTSQPDKSWVCLDGTALPGALSAWSTEQSIARLADFLGDTSHE